MASHVAGYLVREGWRGIWLRRYLISWRLMTWHLTSLDVILQRLMTRELYSWKTYFARVDNVATDVVENLFFEVKCSWRREEFISWGSMTWHSLAPGSCYMLTWPLRLSFGSSKLVNPNGLVSLYLFEKLKINIIYLFSDRVLWDKLRWTPTLSGTSKLSIFGR